MPKSFEDAISATKCKCGCGMQITNPHVLKAAAWILANGGKITSGARCETHNREVGGAEHSQHMRGLAIDWKPAGACPECNAKLFRNLFQPTFWLNEATWKHCDWR